MFLQNIFSYLRYQKECKRNRKDAGVGLCTVLESSLFDLKIWSATETRFPYSTVVKVRRDYRVILVLGRMDKQSAREEINYLRTSVYVAVAEFD